MNLRQLRKQDKRAAVILLAFHQHSVSPCGFGIDSDGRYSYEWRCSYEYDEWDWEPASDYLRSVESMEYWGSCIDPKTGDMLPKDQLPPRQPSFLKKLPPGFRWRGRRVVPVDKHGAMVRTKKGQTP